MKFFFCLQVYRESAYLLKHASILCWIMLDDENSMQAWQYLMGYTPSMMTPKQAVIGTWAKRCSQVVIFSSQKQIDENEETNNLKRRVPTVPLNTTSDPTSWKAYREAVMYLSKYVDKFNWFLLVEEDCYVVMDNLAYYLSIFDYNEPQYFGHVYQTWSFEYNTVGAGVVLSKASMRKLFNYLSKGQWKASMLSGDMALGQCLLEIGIRPADTRDEMGRERFLPMQPETLLIRNYFSWTGLFAGSSKFPIPEASIVCSMISSSYSYVMKFNRDTFYFPAYFYLAGISSSFNCLSFCLSLLGYFV